MYGLCQRLAVELRRVLSSSRASQSASLTGSHACLRAGWRLQPPLTSRNPVVTSPLLHKRGTRAAVWMARSRRGV